MEKDQKKIINPIAYSRQQYSKPEFWNQRYNERGTTFDWYAEYPELKYSFEHQYNFNKNDHILMVGCGNSKLSEQMYEDNYKNIVNIDISDTVIDKMKIQAPEMQWLVMDATQMKFKNQNFDVVIDKGTMDALIAGKQLSLCCKILTQSMRVLKTNGQLILITYSPPEGRKVLYQLALPFDKYDYYFTMADLSDTSALINLMRANLNGRPLSYIVKEKQIFTRTMQQYGMVKLLRSRRNKDKQYVIWSNHEAKGNTSFRKQNSKNENLKGVNDDIILKDSSKIQQNCKESNQLSESNKIANDSKKQQSKIIPQQSKKQTYVYVYSIRRKFASNIEDVKKQIDECQLQIEDTKDGIRAAKGIADRKTFQFILSLQQQKQLLKAIKYLKVSKVSYCNVLFSRQYTKSSRQEQTQIIKLVQGHKSVIKVASKSIINLKIHVKQVTINVYEIFNNLMRDLIDKFDLHPNPKIYEFFYLLKKRYKCTVNKLLKQYWYPTWKINSYQQNYYDIDVALPPITQYELCFEMIMDVFCKKKLIADAEWRYKGHISCPEINLISTINMACISHNNGESLELQLQDFPKNSVISIEENSSLYVQLEVEKNLLVRLLCNLLSLYE